MKCDRCAGTGFVEPRDGKRLDCPACGGRKIVTAPFQTEPDGRLTTTECRPGFAFDRDRWLWIESDDAFEARRIDPEAD